MSHFLIQISWKMVNSIMLLLALGIFQKPKEFVYNQIHEIYY